MITGLQSPSGAGVWLPVVETSPRAGCQSVGGRAFGVAPSLAEASGLGVKAHPEGTPAALESPTGFEEAVEASPRGGLAAEGDPVEGRLPKVRLVQDSGAGAAVVEPAGVKTVGRSVGWRGGRLPVMASRGAVPSVAGTRLSGVPQRVVTVAGWEEVVSVMVASSHGSAKQMFCVFKYFVRVLLVG